MVVYCKKKGAWLWHIVQKRDNAPDVLQVEDATVAGYDTSSPHVTSHSSDHSVEPEHCTDYKTEPGVY